MFFLSWLQYLEIQEEWVWFSSLCTFNFPSSAGHEVLACVGSRRIRRSVVLYFIAWAAWDSKVSCLFTNILQPNSLQEVFVAVSLIVPAPSNPYLVFLYTTLPTSLSLNVSECVLTQSPWPCFLFAWKILSHVLLISSNVILTAFPSVVCIMWPSIFQLPFSPFSATLFPPFFF